MINRASVQLWAIAGQTAGPPKSAGKKRGRGKLLPILRHGSDFIYTKNSARWRSDFPYTKNSARWRYDFIYTKNFLREIVTNQWYIWKIFRAARANLLSISWEKAWKCNDIVKNFPRCARQIVKNVLGKIMQNQCSIQKFSALRAPNC